MLECWVYSYVDFFFHNRFIVRHHFHFILTFESVGELKISGSYRILSILRSILKILVRFNIRWRLNSRVIPALYKTLTESSHCESSESISVYKKMKVNKNMNKANQSIGGYIPFFILMAYNIQQNLRMLISKERSIVFLNLINIIFWNSSN